MGRLISNAIVGHQADMQGVAIDPEAFKIKDADKYREDARTQYDSANENRNYIQPKQRSFLDTLEKQASGQGPSLAVEQLKQAQNRSLAQQMAAAQSARGGNPALLQRQAMQNAAQNNTAMAGQATQARMQEQLQAQQMYGNQVNLMQGNSDQRVQQYLQQGFSIAQAQQAAAADFQHLSVNQAMGLAGINAGIQTANHQQDVSAMNKEVEDIQKFATMGVGGMMGGSKTSMPSGGSYLGGNQMAANMGNSQFMQGATPASSSLSGSNSMSMGMLSDETQKQDIKSSSKDVKGFLDKLSEKSYEYKNSKLPGTASGRRFGIIAQDLEKSQAGKSIVKDTEYGKMVDTQQGFGLALSALAHLNKRLSKLEK